MKTQRWCVLLLLAGCHDGPIDHVRFANRPPVTVVDDRRDVPKAPPVREPDHDQYAFVSSVQEPIDRTLGMERHRRALGVNSIDEVPDSTWFTNRPPLEPDDVARGPMTVDSPALHAPWKVLRNKFGGATIGFIIEDTRGLKYLIKLEDPRFPEAMTGAEAVIDRLLWAVGLNVPEDEVVLFSPDQLEVVPGGKVDSHQIAATLAKSSHMVDGRYRALASRWIEGTPLGPAPGEGVRHDDPNDVIPHERRRDLRGMSVVYAWLDMTDVWPGNLLDVWTADAGKHYVKHYVLDFDGGFGMLGVVTRDMRMSHEYEFDWGATAEQTVTLGTQERAWEKRPKVNVPSVAMTFTAADLDPGHWRPALPYMPFTEADRFDSFWGAKLIAKFTREQIRAAVEIGRFADQRTADYLTDTLIARQRKLVDYWYKRVNPLDHFAIENGLCFEDLAISQGYVKPGVETIYELEVRDTRDKVLDQAGVSASPNGHTCVRMPALDKAAGYVIVEIRSKRPGQQGTTKVHIQRDAKLNQHVVGIWRT